MPGPPWTAPNGTYQTYDANCHCGAVRYKLALSPPLEPTAESPETHKVMECNCSICSRNGYLLIYPFVKDVTWTQGKEDIGEYFMGSKTMSHWFCKKCGSSLGVDLSSLPTGQAEPRQALNVSWV